MANTRTDVVRMCGSRRTCRTRINTRKTSRRSTLTTSKRMRVVSLCLSIQEAAGEAARICAGPRSSGVRSLLPGLSSLNPLLLSPTSKEASVTFKKRGAGTPLGLLVEGGVTPLRLLLYGNSIWHVIACRLSQETSLVNLYPAAYCVV